jgi:DNA polymerase
VGRRFEERPARSGADASAFLPAERTLEALRTAAVGCRGCPLWERGTQTVFGAGAVKWEPRGKKRIHQKPSAGEIRACSPWFIAELEVVRPGAPPCMGATAAQAVLGRAFRVTAHRGELLATRFAPVTMATVHPSSILRAPDDDARRRELAHFVEDLRILRRALEAKGQHPAPL